MKKRIISLIVVLLISVFTMTSCLTMNFGGEEMDTEELNELYDQIEKLEDKIKDKNSEIDRLEDEIADYKITIKNLQSEISNLEYLDTTNKSKIAKLESDYAAKVAELAAEKTANANALAALKAEHKKEVDGLNVSLAELQAAYGDKVAELEAEKTANANAITTLKAEYELKIETIQNNFAQLENSYNNKVAELEAEKAANAKALADLKSEHDAEIKALETENANLVLQIAELEAKIEELLNDKDYIVTFDINGGEGAIADQSIRYKMTVDEPTAPTKEHYDFLGWYVGGVKVEFPYVVIANTEFVAEYAPTKYTITYNVNDGTMPESYVTEYDVETGITLPTPTRDLYLFDGWYEDAKFSGEEVTAISVGDFGNKTYYAKWLSTTNGIKYQLSNDGTYYTVTGYEGKDTVIVIPDSVDGIPVTRLAYKAFMGKQRITSITVPDSVTYIGESAFGDCISLTELNLGDGIKTIPSYMAYGCSKLESIVIPDSVTTIGSEAFSNCSSLVSVTIPDSVTTIGNHAFYDCDSLESVTIPDSVTTIGSSAFGNCYSLVSVVIGDSVTSIGNNAFYYCSSLVSVVIPDSVTTIGDCAFFDCYSLTSVVIGDSVTTIGQQAFHFCDSLYVVYNNSDLLLEIGSTNNGYLACYAKILIDHGEVSYRDDEYNYTLTDDGFLYREKNSKYELISYFGGEDTVTLPESINGNSYSLYYMSGVVNVIIPESFTTISDYAFYNCYSLVSVTIPDSVEFIGEYAFSGCSSLVSVTIPDSVTTIGREAFRDCDSLVSVDIPDSVTTIGAYAFAYSNKLTSVVIGDSVTSIGQESFRGCDSLTRVVIGNSVTSISVYVFDDCDSLTEVYYNGSETEWNNISISSGNDLLTNATRYYYSETEPTEEGNFWHWGDNGEVVVW